MFRRYYSLPHRKQPRNEARLARLEGGERRRRSDGLRSAAAAASVVRWEETPLYTNITVLFGDAEQ